LDDLVERYRSQVLALRLDVTDEAEGQIVVDRALQAFGRLDILVNNAGYGDNGAFEQIPPGDFRHVIETCLFGAVNLTRAVLPAMRRQRSGHVIQISSAGGRLALAGNAAYYTAKWALGGFTEAVAKEVQAFGVHVTALEPGGLRTSWGKRAYSERADRPALLPDYEATVGAVRKQLESYWGNEEGDPARVAQLVLKVADAAHLPPHILLGSGAFKFVRQVEQARAADGDRWRAVTDSIDVTATGPLPDLPSA
jgi:NAD(P)-dependent dehydrogenase (short-subunit alcohol dehydrogenase family)